MGSFKVCGCFTRKFTKAEVQLPSDVKGVFEKYVGSEAAYMRQEQLQRFMMEVQGESEVSAADAERIIEEILKLRTKHPHIALFNLIARKSLSLDDFYYFLFSVDLNPPLKSQVHQDMTAPLSHYFIYTGHNSYLTGNQISSDCSDVPIIKALQRGVRVIELDLWPNPAKDGVHVLHGKTLTTPVDLLKCLKSIQEHAFSASPYPVILTLEDHLNPNLQAKVAHMLVETFGDMLFHPKSATSNDFPSPEELKYKILVSTKPPKEYLAAVSSLPKESETETINNDKSAHEDVDDEDEKPPEYKRLIAIPGIPRGKLEESLKVVPDKASRLSWSEQTLEKATTSHGTNIIRFTQKNILRIFPKISRLDSSNYNPFGGWIHGAQMVAFNMQGYGKPLWLMHGMFKGNGGCGYVKKPDFLLHLGGDGLIFDPKADLPIKMTLKVTIYLGDGWHADFKQTHFDAYSPPDFYAKVGIAGVPTDSVMKKTKVMEDQWSPVWNEEFSFPLTVPELALLRVEVHEHDTSEKDDFAGQTCLPISELRPGFRAVPLYNYKGHKYDSVKLLMRFTFV